MTSETTVYMDGRENVIPLYRSPHIDMQQRQEILLKSIDILYDHLIDGIRYIIAFLKESDSGASLVQVNLVQDLEAEICSVRRNQLCLRDTRLQEAAATNSSVRPPASRC